VSKALDETSNGRAEPGREAFIYVSGKLGIDWTSEAFKAVAEVGLVPFFYHGLEPEILVRKYQKRFELTFCVET
jgi:hypothetical protein